MSVSDALAMLASGKHPGDRMLASCRLQWAGTEVFGEEAIVEACRDAPVDLGAAVAVETPIGAALVGDDAALIADLYDGRIGRLWRLGAGEPPDAERAVAVAFDPDLRQQRGHVYFRAEDHPALPAGAGGAVLAAGQALIDLPGTHRARAFVLRAFADAERAVALFAVHQLSGGVVREGGFGHAVALIDQHGGQQLVRDPRRPREWTPRL